MTSRDAIVRRRLGTTVATLSALAMLACAAGGGGEKHGAGAGSGVGGGGGGTTDPLFGGNGGDMGLGATTGVGNTASLAMPTCSASCADFPEAPILETGAPKNAADLFGAVDPAKFTGPAPCVLEPQLSSGQTPGTLFPANWLRPRFRFAGAGNLFEIRVSSEVEAHELVAYTTTPLWIMPPEIWTAAGPNNAGKSLTVTIRALDTGAPGKVSGVQGKIDVAPVNAGGSMVFWSVKDSSVGPDSSKLYGFSVGEEGVVEILAPKTVKFSGVLHEAGQDLRGDFGGGKPGFAPGEVQCIGCHTSTPDGAAVIFTDDWPWDKVIASVEETTQGQIPTYLSPGARTLMKMPWLGTQSTSPGHWATGDRRLLASYSARSTPFEGSNQQKDRLMWIDLETQAPISDDVPPQNSGQRAAARDARNAAITAAKSTAWDVLAMDGESASAVVPDWNNKGDTIVYTSTDKTPDGHPDYTATRADVYTVPYNGGKGGAVTPLSGASDPNFLEYYPAYSGDDQLIAFNRAPAKNASGAACPGASCPDGPYYNRYSDVNVIPSGGGTPVRLAANDAVACAGDDPKQGLLNSWPKWSPHATSVDGKTYYFLIFSSARKSPASFAIPRGMYTPATLDTRSSQLYMTAIVVDDTTHAITTYPALYLWNQDRVVANGAVTDAQNSNLTPAWDEFLIPKVKVPR
ncbi:MAG TPA: hypothetical protein VF395_10335 [Polyangiaceae bacterium]